MKKKLIIFFFIGISVVFIKNLGSFFDITVPPKLSDLIVSFGGDNGNRLKQTLKIYENNLSKSGKLILTGVDNFDQSMKLNELDWRAVYLNKKGILNKNIIYDTHSLNTLEEIKFIKKYMLQNSLHSVLFISDAAHSRRLRFFTSVVSKYGDNNISVVFVGTKSKRWSKELYYKNPESVIFIVNEVVKLTYYYLSYLLGALNE